MKQIDVLKEKMKPMVQKLKPLTDRIGRFFQRLSPQALKYTIWATIAVVSFAFGLIIGCENSQGPKFRFFSQDLGTTEVIDRFMNFSSPFSPVPRACSTVPPAAPAALAAFMTMSRRPSLAITTIISYA